MPRKKAKPKSKELDSVFLLKILLYLILGTQWVWLVDPQLTTHIPLPVGPLIGLLFARHEHFQIDRKIEYAVLVIAAGVSFLLSAGVYIILL
jgi:hypothetical protein